MSNKRKKAFTLAEVLITLGIIGVVAAMTIPILINNSQKQQYLTGLKKGYSTTNQALVQMAADNNCTGDLKCTGFFSSKIIPQTFGNEFVKYFKVIKNCDDSNKGCFADKVALNYDGTRQSENFEEGYRFTTADGMSFQILNPSDDCAAGVSSHVTNNLTQICGEILIDVNGLKGPNYFGKDIFTFLITNGKGPLLYPPGGADDGNFHWQDKDGTALSCDPSNTDGVYCAARVMEEGWKIDY